MKIKDISKNLFEDTDLDPKDRLEAYFMALKANDVKSVPTKQVLQDIKQKYGIEVGFPALSDLLSKSTLVSDINQQEIQLASDEGDLGREEIKPKDKKEKVRDMAKSASSKSSKEKESSASDFGKRLRDKL